MSDPGNFPNTISFATIDGDRLRQSLQTTRSRLELRGDGTMHADLLALHAALHAELERRQHKSRRWRRAPVAARARTRVPANACSTGCPGPRQLTPPDRW